jgi:hypothetical protein
MTYSASTVLLAAAALMLAPVAGLAGSSSTDWTLGPGGLYSFAGGASSLVGSDIPIVSVLGDSTPNQNGVLLSVTDGLLNFTSGPGTSGTWNWSTGGTLDITGCITGVTTNCNPSTNVLVNDDFTSVSIVQVGGAIDAVFGNVTGTLEQSVASYFGVPTAFSTGSFTAVIATTGSTGSAFVGTNLLGVLKADPPAMNAPEYWSIGESVGFFGIVIVAFAVLIRRGALRSHLFQDPGRS